MSQPASERIAPGPGPDRGSPGSLQVLSIDHPNLLIGTYPTVMIPAFTVPSSIMLHVLSLWQLRRLARKPQTSG
jgi:hypothetical protein